MADKKISELTALAAAADNDLIAVVDVSAGETKYITKDNLGSLGEHEEKKTLPQSIAEKIPWMAVGALIIYLFLHNSIIR